MEQSALWYQTIKKPFFAPPAFAFGVAWSILYPIIFASFGYAIYLVYKKKLPKVTLIPLFANLASNLTFSYIQFGLKNNYLATADILVVLVTLVWFTKIVKPHAKPIALAQFPYLVWVLFATLLQLSITWLNK